MRIKHGYVERAGRKRVLRWRKVGRIIIKKDWR
jgi:hypothetical protein